MRVAAMSRRGQQAVHVEAAVSARAPRRLYRLAADLGLLVTTLIRGYNTPKSHFPRNIFWLPKPTLTCTTGKYARPRPG